MFSFSYSELSFHLGDSNQLRGFCRLSPSAKTPMKSALQSNIGSLRAETWEPANKAIVLFARACKVESGRWMCTDTTVVESNKRGRDGVRGAVEPRRRHPAGRVISPLLANVYLHEVLDVWFEREVRPRLRGRATLIRYADDIAVVFSCEDDARRIGEVLPKRFETYGLTLHPDKTRLVEFRRLDLLPPQGGDGPGSPGTFDLLGFTHFWGLSRQGKWVVKRRTACDRFNRALKRITGGCKLHRHDPVHEQWQALSQKLRGHFGYYGITGNYEAIHRFWEKTKHAWRKWLGRRSRRVGMSRDRMDRLLERYRLPLT